MCSAPMHYLSVFGHYLFNGCSELQWIILGFQKSMCVGTLVDGWKHCTELPVHHLLCSTVDVCVDISDLLKHRTPVQHLWLVTVEVCVGLKLKWLMQVLSFSASLFEWKCVFRHKCTDGSNKLWCITLDFLQWKWVWTLLDQLKHRALMCNLHCITLGFDQWRSV